MRAVWPALVVVLFCVGATRAAENDSTPEQSLIGQNLSVSKIIELAPGALGTLRLSRPATALAFENGAVASGYVANGNIALITARGAGETRIDARDAAGLVIESFSLSVRKRNGDITGSLPPDAGPSSDHPPSAQDIAKLLGSRFLRRLASSKPTRQPLPEPATLLAEGEQARPPIGWHQFCRFYPTECATPDLEPVTAILDTVAWRQLVAVNDAVNHRIEPMQDMEHHHVVEHWDYPMDGKGDCEDYALLKRRMLLNAGWPRQALLMTVVRDRNGDGHAVLIASTDHGDFVLDNEDQDVVAWSQTGYQFIKRQARDNPNHWVSLSNSDAQVAYSSAAQ